MEKLLRKFLTGYLLLLVTGLWAQTDLANKARTALKTHTEELPTEKAYLHTDKPHYALGENLWFKAYLCAGPQHLPSGVSNLLYVELINPSHVVVASRYIEISEGAGVGDFALDRAWVDGPYLLRAYTNYMRNFPDGYFFQREVQLFDSRKPTPPGPGGFSDYSLSFMPEGGDLVTGIPSQIGIKAVNNLGEGITVEGKIVDETGTLVTAVKTYRFGLGVFNLSPAPEKTYECEVTHQGMTKKFKLPTPLSQGLTLQLNQRVAKQISVQVRSVGTGSLQGYVLIGQVRGQSVFAYTHPSAEDKFNLSIPTDSIPEGIAQFTLFKPNGEPVCERLVFVDNPKDRGKLAISADKTTYGPRQKVNIGVQASDFAGGPLFGNFSATVTDRNSVYWSKNGTDIRSYLLLQSDLQGRIEDPGYFFAEETNTRKQLLDMLMLTQGWRRFSWKSLMNGVKMNDLAFLPEQGFSISGRTTKLNQPKASVKADVMISVFGKEFSSDKMSTDESGKFRMMGFNFRDSTKVNLQAAKLNTGRKPKAEDANRQSMAGDRDVSIVLDGIESAPVNPKAQFSLYANEGQDKLKLFLNSSRELARLDSIFAGIWTINLEEFTVRSQRKLPTPYGVTALPYTQPSWRVTPDSIPNSSIALGVFDLIRGHVPGVQIKGSFPDQILTLRGQFSSTGSSEPLFLVDGNTVDAGTFNSTPVSDVAFVDVLVGTKAAIYGIRGANGAIALWTRRDGSRNRFGAVDLNGVLNFKHPGFYKARQFYSPNYDKKLPEHDRPDNRTTLHWSPTLKTDEKGMVQFNFYTSDKGGDFDVIIEGLSRNGIPVVGRLSVGK